MSFTLPQELKKLNKLNINLGAFASIGLPLLATPFLGWAGIALFPIGIPLYIKGKQSQKALDGKSYSAFPNGYFKKLYQEKFANWFEDYVSNSKNLTEQKYKVLFTTMWFENQNLAFREFTNNNNETLNDINRKLLESGDIQKSLTSFVENIDSTNKLSEYLDFMENDIDNEEKMSVAREVYKDFEHFGWLGKNIKYLTKGITPTLLTIQNNQFTKEDYQEIVLLTKKMEIERAKPKTYDYYLGNKIRENEIFVNKDFPVTISKILEELKDKEKINILKNFLSYIDDSFSMYNKEKVLDNIDDHLASIELAEKLDKKMPTKKSATKKKL